MTKTIKALNTEDWFKLRASVVAEGNDKRPIYCRYRNAVLIWLMGDCGLRVGEVSRLRQRDLWVCGEVVSAVTVRTEIAKNHVSRIIPLCPNLRLLLLSFMMVLKHNKNLESDCFMFFTRSPERAITVRQVERIVTTAGKVALSCDLNPHMLRHTFATRAMRVSSSRVVQKLLGHSSLTSTQVYTHPNSTDLKDAIGKMDAAAPQEKSE